MFHQKLRIAQVVILIFVAVYSGSGFANPSVQKIIDSPGADNDEFGHSVAISGNTAIIGAWKDDVGAITDAGSASIYRRDTAGNWIFESKLTAFDAAASDEFGKSVAISGDTVIIGACSCSGFPSTL